MGESCRELKGPRVDLKALGEVAGSRRVDLECPGMDFGIPGVGIYPIAPPPISMLIFRDRGSSFPASENVLFPLPNFVIVFAP